MVKIANDNPHHHQDGELKDNIVIPFQLQESGLRGRCIRLGSELHDIIEAHNYPDAISHLVADTVTLAVALSSMLKYEGIFTLQASGKGCIKTLVADVVSDGSIRGCASFDKDTFAELKPSDGFYEGYHLKDLLGEGYLAFTVDQGAHTERYQGIVGIEGDRLQESVAHYFEQSEQLRTSLCAHSQKTEAGWRSGALMLQFLPDGDAAVVTFSDKTDAEKKEDWNRSKILLQTCRDAELIDPDLHPHELLRRLFHEEGVIVYDDKAMFKNCRCSEDRVRAVVESLSDDDKEYAMKDGAIEMTCEFCSKTYRIDVSD